MNRRLVVLLLCALSAICSTESQTQSKDPAPAAARSKIYVDGKLLPSSRVLVKDGVSYVEVTAIADAMGASTQAGANGYTITAPPAKLDCEHPVPQGRKFSRQFRDDMTGVADEIESLRAVVMKMKQDKEKEKVTLGPRFDEIDRKLSLSTSDVQTDADMAVYYALSYANNSLAISYYKVSRGASESDEQEIQLDSMICSMESKFALMKGMLLPGGRCSVLKRMESQTPVKLEEATHPPPSSEQPQR